MRVVAKKNDHYGLVKKGKEYVVLGVLINNIYSELNYLVSHSRGWPHWKPSESFDVLDSDILPDWHIKMYDKNDSRYGLFCLSGFNELCNDQNYYEALIERESWALDIYSKKYEDAVEWYEVKPFMTKKISLW